MNDMITKDYVSFETAKLLKEKGFDEPCYQCYVLIDKFVETSYYEFAVNSKLIKFERLYADEQPLINSKGFRDFINNKDKSRVFAAPTLQMAMKWLREVHHLFIQIEYECEDCFVSDIYSMTDYDKYGEHKHYPPTFVNCKTYEQACEAAVKHCLEKLI